MNPASTDASQTITVAAIQVPIPRIDRPSVRSVVMISDARVAISATPPRSAAGLMRSTLTRNGCRSAKTIVKTATATTKPVAFRLMRSSTAAATISPTAFETNAISSRTSKRIMGSPR